uniref:Trophoblast glycoprotein n=1 Tax=Neolamprologus brichardi TaxID=32507 RepID=A0A3Q4GMM2_NEOBR
LILRKSCVMFLLFLLAIVPSGHGCPEECLCSSQTVKCQNKDLDKIPHFIPNNTKILFVGNELEYVDTMAFNNLPNLVWLDLSNNTLQNFSESAFPSDNKLQHLNLSRSFRNLVQLTVLDLSNNDLVILPSDIFAGLSSLDSLSLQNSSIINIHNGTLRVPPLRDLDLRDNSLKYLSSTMMAEFSLKPDLRIQLAGNPWHCNCFIEDTLMWLKNSTQVVDVQNLTCTNPKDLRRQPLLQLEKYELKCSMEMKGVLGTSYVFLGLVDFHISHCRMSRTSHLAAAMSAALSLCNSAWTMSHGKGVFWTVAKSDMFYFYFPLKDKRMKGTDL